MAQTIGAAGIKYGQGRVSALTKAINLENLGSQNRNTLHVYGGISPENRHALPQYSRSF